MNILKKVFLMIILIVISTAVLLIGKGYDMYKEALSKVPLENKIEMIKQKDNYTKIEELPQMYIDAVISVEDHRFYKHNGIDVIAICRAAFNDIKAMEYIEGGSTITQQLSKNIYFTRRKNNYKKNC